MVDYEIDTQPEGYVSYLVHIVRVGKSFIHIRMQNKITLKSKKKYIPGDNIFIDSTYKHPRAANLSKVYIKQSFADLELSVYESF